MRVGTKNRWGSIALAVSYLLVVSGSSYFHSHSVGGCCDHDGSPAHCESNGHRSHHNDSQSPPQQSSDSHGCSVCQFLGEKPAPIDTVTLSAAGELVREAVLPLPARVVAGVFSAWHSRGPPLSA